MKRISIIFVTVFLFFMNLSAQLVVASPGTDTAIEAQTLVMSELAIREQIKEYQYYIEYISQFVEIVASIRNTTSTIQNISKIGKTLKEKSAKEWLKDVETNLSKVIPEFDEISDDISGSLKSRRGLMKGKYSGYVSKWDKETKNYHEKLIENYENHVMFPELYPTVSKMGDEFLRSESSKKVIHKAWIESGMEYEMKNDIVRKNTFKKYYDEYVRQAKANDNIEAFGLANIMQSQYLTVESLENIRKNSDMTAMKEQFEKDSQKAYLDVIRSKEIDEKRKNRPTRNNGIFGLDKSDKK